MMAYIVTFVLGIVCIVLGISHMKGNISSLHSYHKKRVSEEDRMVFGKKVGIGTIIIGIGLILFGGFSAAAHYTENESLVIIGMAVFFVFLAVGTGFSFYAMIKYNKGIF